MLPLTGCTTHQCDASTEHFAGGHMVTADSYETSPLASGWISYGPNVTLTVDYSGAVIPPRVPAEIYADISVDPNPGLSDAGYVQAAGNLALIQPPFSDTGFTVTNGTCAMYWVHFFVTFEPLDAGADVADAGAE